MNPGAPRLSAAALITAAKKLTELRPLMCLTWAERDEVWRKVVGALGGWIIEQTRLGPMEMPSIAREALRLWNARRQQPAHLGFEAWCIDEASRIVHSMRTAGILFTMTPVYFPERRPQGSFAFDRWGHLELCVRWLELEVWAVSVRLQNEPED